MTDAAGLALVETVAVEGVTLLAPAGGQTRWNPDALGAALRALAKSSQTGPVVVPVGDDEPAGDAAALWGGDVDAMRAALRGLDLQVLVRADRPLVGFHGMSNALRDGREGDAALAVAAQAQEERWSTVARATDPGARSSLLGPARLSDAPGTGACGRTGVLPCRGGSAPHPGIGPPGGSSPRRRRGARRRGGRERHSDAAHP
ncbi:hypothetical protein [Demequina litorisediminis]|uniref:Uncharacterized protein n=1 Tax=Demequina litorisediminis TaxID=1849022 RepID=A0ABQ6I9R2_9MICO|nr:hypothetical protein [Demequina litorisediminis]GMA33991.1 hypothetical protein GCM10025876_01950 [Demequina litorisediminis]